MHSHLTRTVQLALKSLTLHKLRSGLTMLGIVFGVFSVIAMLAIGEGASAQAQKQVLELGATNIICVSRKPPQESATTGQQGGFMLRYGLLRKDHQTLSRTIPTVTAAIPIREVPRQVRYRSKDMNCRLVGCTAEYLNVNHLELSRGRFIVDTDDKRMDNVCVLAAETAELLFSFENPLGKAVQVGGLKFQVIGVTKARTASAAIGGSMSGQDYNQDVYIPIETFRVRIGDQVAQRTSGSFSMENVELNQITLKVDGREAVIPTAEVVEETLRENHPKKDYDIVVPLELLKQADQLRMIFNVVLGLIAAISLLVGGIGIMNIMLATVTERTREIGIRRALGAKQHDITVQFLTETVVLAGSGGLIGIIFGLLTPVVFSLMQWIVGSFVLDESAATTDFGRIFLEMIPAAPLWSIPLAFGISVGTGIIFGIYPARSAARLDPIEALRHE